MYAYFKRLDYFSTECVYAPFAARGAARDFVKDLEARPPAHPASRVPRDMVG
jgi:cytoplasmic tRNA 2-thiolation protein 1